MGYQSKTEQAKKARKAEYCRICGTRMVHELYFLGSYDMKTGEPNYGIHAYCPNFTDGKILWFTVPGTPHVNDMRGDYVPD